MNLRKYISDPLVVSIVALISVGLLVLNFVCDKTRNSEMDRRIQRLDSLQYRYSSIDHQPLLKLVSNPTIEGASVAARAYMKSALFNPSTPSAKLDTLVTRTIDTVTIVFRLFNSTNQPATILLEALWDTSTFVPVLRTRLGQTSEFEYSDRVEQVAARDTIEIRFKTKVFSEEGGQRTLHFQVLYKNYLDQLYDSYFWIDANLKEARIWREYRDSSGVRQTRIVKDPPDIQGLITFPNQPIDAYEVYSQEEATRIMNWLNSLPKN